MALAHIKNQSGEWTRGKQKVSKQTQNHSTLLNTNKLFTTVSARKKTFHGLFCCGKNEETV